jgi:hypothetical protein
MGKRKAEGLLDALAEMYKRVFYAACDNSTCSACPIGHDLCNEQSDVLKAAVDFLEKRRAKRRKRAAKGESRGQA